MISHNTTTLEHIHYMFHFCTLYQFFCKINEGNISFCGMLFNGGKTVLLDSN